MQDTIVKVRRMNWQSLIVTFSDGTEREVPRTAKMAKRMGDNGTLFFHATVGGEDGSEIKFGKMAPWQGMDFGKRVVA
jgi:hypothetical protein